MGREKLAAAITLTLSLSHQSSVIMFRAVFNTETLRRRTEEPEEEDVDSEDDVDVKTTEAKRKIKAKPKGVVTSSAVPEEGGDTRVDTWNLGSRGIHARSIGRWRRTGLLHGTRNHLGPGSLWLEGQT